MQTTVPGMPRPSSNPLASFMRQAKIYIKLPSEGKYWEKDSINIPENGELAVYSMTAKDELAFKTPDALMNGQAVVDVIQSCIPDIKNAWKMPNIDVDMILIAIRIATYGELMDITHTVPNTDITVDHQVNLQILLDKMSQNIWEEAVEINKDLTCFVQPLTYKHVTMTSMKAFESRRLMEAINNEDLPDEKKLEIFNQSFNKMTDITIELISDSIASIQTPNTVVTNRQHIKEFMQNADKDVFTKIQAHINRMKDHNGLPELTFESTPEQIEQGAPESYSIPVRIDNSDFFGQNS